MKNLNELKMKKSANIYLFLIIVSLIIFPGNMNYLHHGYLSGFMVQNWSISYDTGFVLRGLPGTIMSALFNPISSKEVMYVVYIMLIIYVAYIFIAIRALYKLNPTSTSLVFLLFILVQPSVLQRWISSAVVGRLDSLLAVIFISIIFIVIKSKRSALKYVFTNILTLIAILSHEGFAVFFVPTIFALMLITEKKLLRPALFYLAPSVIIWGLTVLLGGANVPLEQMVELLNKNAVTNTIYPFEPAQLDMIYYMSLSDKIAFTIGYYNNTRIAKVILTFILMIPSILCILGYWRALYKSIGNNKEKFKLVFLAIATLSPLFAMIFAIDTYRWIGWALFINVVALAILFYINECYRNVIIGYTKKHTLKIVFAIVVALLIGYFTVFTPYPVIENYFPAVYTFFFG